MSCFLSSVRLPTSVVATAPMRATATALTNTSIAEGICLLSMGEVMAELLHISYTKKEGDSLIREGLE